MLHTKMCNVRTYVTHEYEMVSVRTYVTCENIICPNLCYTRTYDIWCMLHTKMCNVQFSFPFSEFGPRHSLRRWQSLCLDLVNIIMCMQNVLRLFQKVQEIGSVSFFFFRICTSAKPRPMTNGIRQSLGLDLVNINVNAKFHHNIPLSSRNRAMFTFSEFGPWHGLDRWQMSFCNPLG